MEKDKIISDSNRMQSEPTTHTLSGTNDGSQDQDLSDHATLEED